MSIPAAISFPASHGLWPSADRLQSQRRNGRGRRSERSGGCYVAHWPALVDIAKDHTISTIGYNGQVPGPVIRLREGVAATVDLFNDTDSAELVHWHGFHHPTYVDGAEEEKSLSVLAHGHLRYRLTPGHPAPGSYIPTSCPCPT